MTANDLIQVRVQKFLTEAVQIRRHRRPNRQRAAKKSLQ